MYLPNNYAGEESTCEEFDVVEQGCCMFLCLVVML